MGTLEDLIRFSSGISNPHLEEWKGKGGRVVGYTCSYFPEELVHALGMLPFRIRGTGCSGTSLADTWYGPVNCSYTRCCLQLVLEGKYGFLDGAVISRTCDHVRRMYDCWKAAGNLPPFFYYFGVPHTLTEHGLEFYRGEITSLCGALEEHFGKKLEEEELREAVREYNRGRRLLLELAEKRKREAPPVSGEEALALHVASTSMRREVYNVMLEEALEEIEERGREYRGVRLMVVGSVNDDPELFRVIEGQGGVVVTDSLCFGMRSIVDLVEEGGDPFEALVRRYYYHVPCARTYGEFERKLSFLRRLIKEWRVEGVILEHMKFCDTHGGDNSLFSRRLEEEGVPTLILERQYGPLAEVGRIRTRIQAFLERLGR